MRIGIRYRRMIGLLSAGVLLYVCTACQATPDQEYVVNKEGQEQLIQENQSEDFGVLLSEQVNAPEHVEDTVLLREQRMITIDADIHLPEATSIPIYTIESVGLNEETMNRMASALFDGEIYKVSSEEEVMSVSELQMKQEQLQSEIEALERQMEQLENGQDSDNSTEPRSLSDLTADMNQKQTELEQTEFMIYRIENGLLSYMENTADYSFDSRQGYIFTDDGNVARYEYQESSSVGEKDGNTYILEVIKDADIDIIHYHLIGAAEPMYQDYMPDDIELNTGFGTMYEPGKTITDNECKYSLAEARQLCTDTLQEMGCSDLRIVSEQNAAITLMNTSNGNPIKAGYVFYCYRGYGAMSDIRYEKSDEYHMPIGRLAVLDNAYMDDRVLLREITLDSGIGIWNTYDSLNEVYIPATRREIYYVVITDYGVMDLVIVNPKKTKELQVEHVVLMDFAQVLNQAKTLFAAKYMDMESARDQDEGFTIDCIELHYAMMRSPYTSEEYTMIPVWDFMNGGDVMLTLNAIDGSSMDRNELH